MQKPTRRLALIWAPDIVKFREMLEGRIDAHEPPLAEIPEEHKPVIVKLAHERYGSELYLGYEVFLTVLQ